MQTKVFVCSLAALAAVDLYPETQPAKSTSKESLDGLTASKLATNKTAQAADVPAIAAPETQVASSRQAATASKLTDIQGHWAQSQIQALAEAGIIRGFADRTFQPEAPIQPEHFQALMQQVMQKYGANALVQQIQALRTTQQNPALLNLLRNSESIEIAASLADFPASDEATEVTRAEVAAFVHQIVIQAERDRAELPAAEVTNSPANDAISCQTATRSSREALAACDRALKTAGTDPLLLTWRGTLLAKLGQHSEALVAHNQALKLRPRFSLGLVNRCAVQNKLGQFGAAIAGCDQALAGDGQWGESGAAQAWDQRGIALAGLDNLKEALVASDRAVNLKPDYAEAWSNRAVILWRMQQHESALTAAERSVALKPNYAQGWFNVGRILRSLKRYDAAIAAYDRALQSDVSHLDKPTLADIWSNRSAALWLLGNYSQALAATDRAVRIDPNSALAWFNHGGALMALQKPMEAALAYEKAAQLDPGYGDAWTGRGIALQRSGRYEEALEALDQALKLNPNQSLARQTQQAIQKQLQIDNGLS
jgi:tetratricopeptide (TPR) repeat protein